MNVKRTEVFQDIFGTVKVGEAFSVPYGHTIYVKTDVYMKTKCRVRQDWKGIEIESNPEFINAIDLSNGTGRYFIETELVILHEDAVVYSEE